MAKNLAEGMQRPLFCEYFCFFAWERLDKSEFMGFINRELIFGVNLLRRIWMTLDRISRILLQELKKEMRVRNLFNPLEKSNAEIVWAFLIRNGS